LIAIKGVWKWCYGVAFDRSCWLVVSYGIITGIYL